MKSPWPGNPALKSNCQERLSYLQVNATEEWESRPVTLPLLLQVIALRGRNLLLVIWSLFRLR
jgi:hypothetical protein